MRRLGLSIGVSVAALGLGVYTFFQGQHALAACFIGLGVLRAVALLAARKPTKPQPSIRLNIDSDEPKQ